MAGRDGEDWRLAVPDDPLTWPWGQTQALGSVGVEEPECANPYSGARTEAVPRRLLSAVAFELWLFFSGR